MAVQLCPCGRPAKAAGMCWGHYGRVRHHGDPRWHVPIGQAWPRPRTCAGCGKARPAPECSLCEPCLDDTAAAVAEAAAYVTLAVLEAMAEPFRSVVAGVGAVR